MRKYIFKAAAVILTAAVLLLSTGCTDAGKIYSFLQQIYEQTTVKEWTPTHDYSRFFGWNALETAENGKAMQYAYDQIYSAVSEGRKNISFNSRIFPLSRQVFGDAYLIYCYDHPEHFWLDQSSYSTTVTSRDILKSVTFTYLFEGKELEAAKSAMQEKVRSFLQSIPSEDLYETELSIHDRIAGEVTYGESLYAHTAYGALVEGKAVCEGYAKAFQLLMQSCGAPCYMVVGEGREDTHGWDLVQIGDSWCYVDPTWDDTDSDYVSHAFFNMTTERMLEHRKPYDAPFALPICDDDGLYFYNRSQRTLSAPFDRAELAEILKRGEGSLTVMIDKEEDVEVFTDYPSVSTASFHLIGNEVHLSIEIE